MSGLPIPVTFSAVQTDAVALTLSIKTLIANLQDEKGASRNDWLAVLIGASKVVDGISALANAQPTGVFGKAFGIAGRPMVDLGNNIDKIVSVLRKTGSEGDLENIPAADVLAVLASLTDLASAPLLRSVAFAEIGVAFKVVSLSLGVTQIAVGERTLGSFGIGTSTPVNLPYDVLRVDTFDSGTLVIVEVRNNSTGLSEFRRYSEGVLTATVTQLSNGRMSFQPNVEGMSSIEMNINPLEVERANRRTAQPGNSSSGYKPVDFTLDASLAGDGTTIYSPESVGQLDPVTMAVDALRAEADSQAGLIDNNLTSALAGKDLAGAFASYTVGAGFSVHLASGEVVTVNALGQLRQSTIESMEGGGNRLTVKNFDGTSTQQTSYADLHVETVYQDANRVMTSREVQYSGNDDRVEYYNAQNQLAAVKTTQRFDDGSRIDSYRLADGSVVQRNFNDDGTLFSEQATPAVMSTVSIQQQTTILNDLTSLVNAIKAGVPLPIAVSGIKLLNDTSILNGDKIPYLNTTSAVASGILSLYNLDQAFENGDDFTKFQATLGAVHAVNVAYQAVYQQVTGTAVTQGLSTGITNTVGEAVPIIGVIYSLKNGDYAGAAASIATMMGFPVVGWVYAAYSLISALGDEPPEAWGMATYKFGDGTEIALDVVGEAFGPDRVRFLMEGNGKQPGQEGYFGGMLGYLNERIDALEASGTQYGIIAQRLPRVTWREARQGDPGYAVVDVDALTGEQRNAFLRYNDDFSPYNANPADPEQRRDVFERMIISAVQRGAIAPLWEVQTARMQQDAGDPNAGLTEEERAARAGQLAALDAQGERTGHFRPVVLDLNGDNTITTITNANTNRVFDWDDSGFLKQTGWVGAGEGMLFLDRNPNGAVDGGRELFSNAVVADANKGVRSMGWVDANADGVINSLDPVFAQIKVWQDLDGDGQSGSYAANGTFVNDMGEVHTLAELGVTELAYGTGRFTRNGQNYAMQSPELEAEADGLQVSVNPAGIRIDFSNGDAKVVVTQVVGQTVATELVAGNDIVPGQFEDGDPRPRTTPITISIAASLLLANDQVSGRAQTLAITAVGSATHGSVSYKADTGEVLFTPEANYFGDASFAYTVTSSEGLVRSATVTVPLASVTDAPVVGYVLEQRAVYGWGDKVVQQYSDTSGGDHGGQVQPEIVMYGEGSPIYESFRTVKMQRILAGEGEGAVVYGPVEDTLYHESSYVAQVADIRRLAAEPGYEGFGVPSSFTVFVKGVPYRALMPTSSDINPLGYSDPAIPLFYETNNDGQITATEGGGSFRYEVVSDGLYGHATIDADTGHFAYTGNRYVEKDMAGNPILRNQSTDDHSYGEEVFNDVFIVRIYDTSDASNQTYTDKEIAVPHFGPRPNPNVASGGKPIAVDMNGDGLHFIDVDDSNVFFDVNGDGWRRRMAWTSPGDGLLAYDKSQDGKIDQWDEISFVPYAPQGQTDLESLKLAFDSNRDGLFTAADEAWAKFGVWQDANSNGVTDAGEYKSLTELGIASIKLTTDGKFQVIDGQTVHGMTVATRTNGAQLAVGDVTLNISNETQVAQGGTTTTVALPAHQAGQDLVGTANKDLALGTSGNDSYQLGAGDDVVVDDGGNDAVQGGAGDDMLYTGNGKDYIDAGEGDDSVYAGNGDDLVLGGTGNDLLLGEGGNDVVFGGEGNDMVTGGDGNDVLSGDAGDDRLFGEAGWDALFGNEGDDELWGMDGNDQLYAGAGNDLLGGGAGDDVMEGGLGDDTYQVDSAGDTVTELAGEGLDTVRASIGYTLAATLENLVLTGEAAVNATGNALGNTLVGNAAANTLMGLNGNDLLDGGLGADTLFGGLGDDTYTVDSLGDQVVEAAGEGIDTVQTRLSYVLGAHVENLTLTGMDATRATGNALNNTLIGNGSANVLDGGAGADTLAGRGGNDRYVVDHAGDVVLELLADGYDSVLSNLASYTLADNVESLELGVAATGGTGNALANTLRGNALANVLDGALGADVMAGGAGNDTYTVNEVGDQVLEIAGEGVDTVRASISFTAVDNVENVTLLGNANLNAYGNALKNVLVGNAGANQLWGGAGADILQGGAGDDTFGINGTDVAHDQFQGDEGFDTVLGGDGDDTIRVSNFTGVATVERIDGGGGYNVLAGTVYDDTIDLSGTQLVNIATILAGAGFDTVIGSAGNDTIDGGAHTNWLSGGAGNDTFLVNGTDSGFNQFRGDAGVDLVLGGAGDDTIRVNNFTGINTVEKMDGGLGRNVIAGTNNDDTIDLSGTQVVNISEISAGAGYDTVIGSAGNDTIDGGTHTNWLSGGAGDDTFLVKGTDSGFNQFQGDAGFDTVLGGSGDDTVRLNIFSGAKTVEKIDGGLGYNVIAGTNDNDTIDLSGTQVVNIASISTGIGWDTIIGSAGNDVIDGGTYSDTMAGGAGNDTYYVDVAGDVLTELAGEGIDTVYAAVNYTLGGNVENLVINSSAAINATGDVQDNTIHAGAGNNTIDGGAGNDTVSYKTSTAAVTASLATTAAQATGGSGSDILLNLENLTGSAYNDSLTGNTGNNTLDGGTGNDTMAGGAGNDTYVVDATADIVTEAANEGADMVLSSATYTLGANVENITLTGTAAINATGNALNNSLDGNSAANTLTGGAGDDWLNGAGGADTLLGGAGNDAYYVDNAGDVVTELAGEGLDSVFSSVNYTLGNNVEKLELIGTDAVNGTGNALNNNLDGNGAANTLSGGAGDDWINGAGGADTLLGGAGDDIYYADNAGDVLTELAGEGTDTVFSSVNLTLGANLEKLTLMGDAAINATGNALNNDLNGNSAANTLTGGVGDDWLNGAGGADTMVGGVGNDVYYADNTGDVVTELANEGIDTVLSSISTTLGNNLEKLMLIGDAAVNGTGNALNNNLDGNSAANTLTGGAGDDWLNGGGGADTLVGGTGDDIYYVDNTGDVVTELAGEGTDLVFSSISSTLGSNLETLVLTGSAAINATGNALGNVLVGNSGANVLAGGAGNDSYILNRGDGADTITENDATAGNTDVALFGAGITTDQLWFTQTGNNLDVAIIGTIDKFSISNWYLGNQYHVEQFKTSDGKTLLDSQVQNLVQAMAGFAPPAAGQTTLASNYATALAPVLAANWQ
nr:cadherin-like domain-containing protein [uncultured Albidiferax sp.]